MIALKLRRIGNELAVVLPEDVADHLHAQDNGTVLLNETAEGYQLLRASPEIKTQIELVEEAITRYPNTLRDLAK